MQLNLAKIINTRGASLPVSFNEFPESMELIPEDVKLIHPVHFSGTVTNLGGVFQVQGNVRISFYMNCARCTKPLEQELHFDVDEQYTNRLPDDEAEVYSFEGNEISFDEMIVQNILIHLPMRIICLSEEDCAPHNDYSYEGKNNKDDDIDPRLLKLKDLFKED